MDGTFKNTRVLISGGAGFVGTNLVQQLLPTSPQQIVLVDNLLSADITNVSRDTRVQFVEGSIADPQILNTVGADFDYVFHLSTYHGNQSSMANPIADHENNLKTTLMLCEHLKNASQLKKLVYASAGCVVAEKTFDKPSATQEDASVSLYLDSPYQISKMVGEYYLNYYWKQYQLPIVKTRFQNVYGPYEILGAGRWRGTPETVWRNVTPTFIWKALQNRPLPLQNGGVATRDFIYSADLARGLMLAAEKGTSGDVYNLASGQETSIHDWALLICELTQNSAGVEVLPARSWDRSGRRYGDPTKAKQQLGFEAHTSMKEGLKKTIEWTQTHREDILRCMRNHAYYLPEVLEFTE